MPAVAVGAAVVVVVELVGGAYALDPIVQAPSNMPPVAMSTTTSHRRIALRLGHDPPFEATSFARYPVTSALRRSHARTYPVVCRGL